MGTQRRDNAYRRVGNAEKCPACGSRMDPQAYRCPKCLIYFCFKCRARVTGHEPQFQCADQSCRCYGKLLCLACTVIVPQFEEVTRIEYDEAPDLPEHTALDLGCGTFIIAGLAGFLMFRVGILKKVEPEEAAAVGFVAAISVFIWMLLVRRKVVPATTKKVPRQIVENKQIAEHRCCIQCRRPLKPLR